MMRCRALSLKPPYHDKVALRQGGSHQRNPVGFLQWLVRNKKYREEHNAPYFFITTGFIYISFLPILFCSLVFRCCFVIVIVVWLCKYEFLAASNKFAKGYTNIISSRAEVRKCVWHEESTNLTSDLYTDHQKMKIGLQKLCGLISLLCIN